jgi:hypothetical protein
MGELAQAPTSFRSPARSSSSRSMDDRVAALAGSALRFVRRYLERNPQAPLTLRQVDPLIRELTQYRDLIQQRINFEEPQP